ncbi:LLM class F420-dependent oxidoreductase [Kineococcus sp. SYSU DK004]|uniref:LLM class F420-dependent oxidoreductase n=1 Tax=Kineococcus sp. SYSU DK004 TaxID=3383125 RepID=UPI003D7E6340
MRLAVSLGYLTGADVATAAADALALARAAEDAGYAAAWVAEAYGSDAPTVLGWLAARTSRIDLGSAVLQVPARSAAATAMTAATLDGLTGGRFRLGLGVSGPQVAEGWHGQRFDAPLARTREYVEVVRTALARRPLVHDGEHLTLPLPGGPGKPLRLMLPPVRPDLPVYLAAVGPRNVALAGEVADGWLPVFFAPDAADEQLERLAAGRARRVPREGEPVFDVAPTVPLLLTSATGSARRDAEAPVRAYAALYLGGMGSRTQNFYAALARRLGFGADVDRVQDLYLAGHAREAAAAVPDGFLDATCLVGTPAAVRARLDAYAAAGVTTLSVLPLAPTREERVAALRAIA